MIKRLAIIILIPSLMYGSAAKQAPFVYTAKELRDLKPINAIHPRMKNVKESHTLVVPNMWPSKLRIHKQLKKYPPINTPRNSLDMTLTTGAVQIKPPFPEFVITFEKENK